MSFILKWLRPETSSRVGLRPHRTVEMPMGYGAAYDRVLDAINAVLGAYVHVDDRAGRFIEAGFGLINNERIRCSFDLVDDAHTNVRIEAHFPAGNTVPEKSRAVDALAAALRTPSA